MKEFLGNIITFILIITIGNVGRLIGKAWHVFYAGILLGKDSIIKPYVDEDGGK